ncbi:MAG: pantetheine-phosphate adenylyltransferase [Bdellovibrionales bacterium]|nr:pantetheine-phosphate adenylyltransferase [Bdellovibrionales bacterium]
MATPSLEPSRTAVYAGSFDPPTNGHLDIIRRVQPRFGKLYLVIAENARKQALFSTAERMALLQEALKDLPVGSVEVRTHDGLIVDFCRQVKSTVLIRGLRAISDFEGEFQMATMNRRLDHDIETFLIMTDEKYFFVSSSLVKEVAAHGGDLTGLVTPQVEKALVKKCRS